MMTLPNMPKRLVIEMAKAGIIQTLPLPAYLVSQLSAPSGVDPRKDLIRNLGRRGGLTAHRQMRKAQAYLESIKGEQHATN